MDIKDFIIRLIVALLAGLCIGFERQWRHKSAGLKTNMLVSAGSAIFVLLSVRFSELNTDVDVTRIVAQVVTGVGFLGAGVIFREGTNVHGLTSAATIWCSAAIGCVAATGFYLETFVCTLLVIIVNVVINPIDNWLKDRKS
ncbi:magnesium transporter MgtC [Wenyingzhuangia fucanilytica]|uniref:Magnesium transporter MgtC n=1 Tax=Wenyingzhuangia fucanilytica TaxID=1790137 RepID=A0A1B1Y383_9FLAO|nr:MgtC/SapB family protein [Wenyingzhuangia fucanilytica]ANW95242.1 magnesium transporter MgtC [Wenyingzhuangia fucanilytica]